jgi:Xaa-Pro dipeptidase
MRPSPMASYRYIPPTDPATLMWSIPPPDLTLAQQLYESHSIDYLPSLLSSLASLVSSSPSTTIHTLPQTPLFPPFPFDVLTALSPSSSTDAYLLPALHRSRLLKTPHEVKLMEKAVDITSAAHTVVMRELGRYAASRGGSSGEGLKKGEKEKEVGEEAKVRSATLGPSEWEIQAEGDAEAVFTAVCRRNEAKHLAYMPIVASGPRACAPLLFFSLFLFSISFRKPSLISSLFSFFLSSTIARSISNSSLHLQPRAVLDAPSSPYHHGRQSFCLLLDSYLYR